MNWGLLIGKREGAINKEYHQTKSPGMLTRSAVRIGKIFNKGKWKLSAQKDLKKF